MLVLGIETSCDETAASVIQDGRAILSSVVASQEAVHEKFQGIVPELASRAHLETINSIVDEALLRANIGFRDLDAIAVTRGPGLVGSLLVGYLTARTYAKVFKLPLVPVNHLEGHIFANVLNKPDLKPPFLCLIVSGGHTELVLVDAFGRYRVLGRTRDDAAGEVFDKVARVLRLGYPGGPHVDRLAKEGNTKAYPFPRPYLWENWEFSFSGLKTSVVNFALGKSESIGKPPEPVTDAFLKDVCASFQEAVVDVLVAKTVRAAKHFRMKRVTVGGGVAVNSRLRERMQEACIKEGLSLTLPDRAFCTDNAAMIACAGFFQHKASKARKTPTAVAPDLAVSSW